MHSLRVFSCFVYSFALGLVPIISYSTPPPPPPSISNIDSNGGTISPHWGAGTWENINSIIKLTGDTELEGYNSRSGGFDLNGYLLTIGKGGVNIYENAGLPKVYGLGGITSSSAKLNFILKNNRPLDNGYVIDAVIHDQGQKSVGVNISGGILGHKSHVDFTGGADNTFTGNVYVSNLAGLQLYKRNGAVAVRGNITVADGGYLLLTRSNQISDSSILRLDGRGRKAELFFSGYQASVISEKIHRLEVTGSGVIDYYYDEDRFYGHGTHHLYLDDLRIEWGGKLTIKNWALSRDFLLVRKDSEHLNEAVLSRIKFEGHKGWRAALKEYDKDYWQLIPRVPEPSTYGAAFGALAVGVYLICRKQKGPPVCHSSSTRSPSDPTLTSGGW